MNFSTEERSRIIALIRQEVVPAVGCTEPIAVALCAARAAETLGCRPERVMVWLSANMLKNAMGVGIPGTGMSGLPVAVALGVLVGRSEDGLELLKRVTPGDVAAAAEYLGSVAVALKSGERVDTLYIEVEVTAGDRRARCIIAGSHTRFVYLSKDDEVLLDLRRAEETAGEACADTELTMRRVYDFATTAPLDELRFILETARMNKGAAEAAFAGDYGHRLGKIIRAETRIMGDSLFSRMLAYTSAACDARMAGAMIPVMSNSGSGNQGIAATLPVTVYAEESGASEEELIRALVLSHLTVIYIKQSLGRLSALCGCVVAATGSSCGITLLMGGGYDAVAAAVKNMAANLTGMICDGAKPSCALKVSSGVSTALFAAMMAVDGGCVTAVEGIVDDDVDRTIRNLTTIGRDAMRETDRTVLRIMTSKGSIH